MWDGNQLDGHISLEGIILVREFGQLLLICVKSKHPVRFLYAQYMLYTYLNYANFLFYLGFGDYLAGLDPR
jgi:hypothetical protein